MKKFAVMMTLTVLMATPVFAMFIDNFETNPFGPAGNWSRSGDVTWTGGGPGNDYVRLGQSLSNDTSQLCRSFTAPTTGEYCVDFDYRFIGCDVLPKADDRVSVWVGVGREPQFDVFEATSSVDLTGGLFHPGDWETITTPPPVITLEAGQTYWLKFRLQEATGCLTPITSLHLDNIGVEQCNVVPAPGAMLLGGIGVTFIGWLRTKRIL
jgi:hypothetical protein